MPLDEWQHASAQRASGPHSPFHRDAKVAINAPPTACDGYAAGIASKDAFMMGAELLFAFERLGHPHALVLGDLILDRYTWGNAERVSQEAPVILLRADQREARLGGAANVAHMLRCLEAEVTVAAVVGNDADGQELRLMLAEAGVSD